MTNSRIFERPEPVPDAWSQVENWLDADPAWIPEPTNRHRGIVGTLTTRFVDRSNLVLDAHLAALAIEHGLILCSTDGDFARFENLPWTNPLESDGRS